MKNTKRIIACMICLAALLSFVGCQDDKSDAETAETAPAAEETAPAQQESAQEADQEVEPQVSAEFDNDLFGCWDCVEIINNSDDDGIWFKESFEELCILADGTFFWAELLEPYDGGVKATTNGNKIEGLLEAAWQQEVEAGNIGEDVPEPDWEMTYELVDIQESSNEHNNEYYKGFYEKDSKDKLVLNIKGTVQESPVKTSDIDTAIVFEKSFPMFENIYFRDACLLGEWADSQGNTWSFFYSDEDEAELAYTLTTKDGITYDSDFLYHECSYEDAVENFKFYFHGVNLGTMTLISCNSNEFVFEVDGDELVMTKKN